MTACPPTKGQVREAASSAPPSLPGAGRSISATMSFHAPESSRVVSDLPGAISFRSGQGPALNKSPTSSPEYASRIGTAKGIINMARNATAVIAPTLLHDRGLRSSRSAERTAKNGHAETRQSFAQKTTAEQGLFLKTHKASPQQPGWVALGRLQIRREAASRFYFSNLAYFLRKRSIRPAVSTKRCLPVKKGWQLEQISTCTFSPLVDRAST